jgi:hypothetical protein
MTLQFMNLSRHDDKNGLSLSLSLSLSHVMHTFGMSQFIFKSSKRYSPENIKKRHSKAQERAGERGREGRTRERQREREKEREEEASFQK